MRLVAWAILVLFLGFYATIGGTYPWLGLASARILTHLGFGVVAVIWAALAWRQPSWRPDRTLAVAVTAVVGVAAVSAIASPIPRIAFEAVIAGSCLAGAFLFTTCLARDPWFRPRLTSLLVLFAVLLVAAYGVEIVYGWVSWYGVTKSLAFPLRPGGASLTFGAIAAVAALLLLVVPFAVAILWPTRARPIAIVLAGFALLELGITGSRAAYIGAVVGGLVVGLYWLQGRSQAMRQDAIRKARRVLIFAIPVGALVALVFAGPLIARVLDVRTIGERFAIWIAAAKLFLANPLLGTGPGTWPVLAFDTYPSDAPVLVVSHAHDTAVQFAVDFGIVGLACMGMLLFVIARRLSAATRSGDAKLRAPSIAIVGGLAAFTTLSVFDHLVNLGVIVLIIAILAAWSIGATRPSGESTSSTQPGSASNQARQARNGRLAVALLVVCVVAAAMPVALTDRAAFIAEDGIRALERGDWTAAEAAFASAARTDPGYIFYSYELAATRALNGETDQARLDFSRLADVDRAPWVLMSLAYLDLAERDPVAAADHARAALDRGYGDAEIALNVGAIADATGDIELALSARATAVAEAPAIAGSPYWRTTTTSADDVASAARDILLSRKDPISDVDAALVRVYAGDVAGGRDELGRLPASNDVSRALAVADYEDGQQASAMAKLKAILDGSPEDTATLRLLARYAFLSGDRAGSKRYVDWIGLIGGSYSGWAEFIPTGVRIATSRETLTSNFPPAYPWIVFLRLSPPLLTPPDYLVIEDVL